MIEKELTIHSSGYALSATACIPAGNGPVPAVLMIHGSGPLDRNENMKGQALHVFDTIAHHLAAHGIASLRYDKRGCGASEGDYLTTGHADFVDDAVCGFDALAMCDFADPGRIFVLGHSEGCIIAPQVAEQRPKIAGQILLCPYIDTLESILCKQAEHISQKIKTERGAMGIVLRLYSRVMGSPITAQRKLIAKLKSTESDSFRFYFRKVPAKWLRQMLELDPPTIFSRVECPSLIIGGEKDMQCDPADVSRIAECVNGPVVAHVIENLTHILRIDPDQPSILSTHRLLQAPVDEKVLETITVWLEEFQRPAPLGA